MYLVFVIARDRKTLAPGNTLVEGNRLFDFSLWKRMYQPGIDFDAVSSRFFNNTMFRAPHSGMLGHANNWYSLKNRVVHLSHGNYPWRLA
jgi:hypothetical protein